MPQYIDSKQERIAMLNRLTAYYFGSALRCSDNTKRDDLFNQAGACIRQADRQDINSKSNWVCRGFLLLYKGQLDTALYYFNNTLEVEPFNIFALLGKACAFFHRRDYSEALKLYGKVLRQNPNVPANIRFAVAYCQYKLGNKTQARQALDRGFSLGAQSADALVCKALLDYDSGDYSSYLQNIAAAFQLDHGNQQACLHLAKHYFYKEDYDRSIKLADFCLNRISEQEKQLEEITKLRVECQLILAQCYHAKGDMETAFRHYSAAVRLDSEFPLAQFGLGQMYLQQKDMERAQECFEKVHSIVPNNYETLKILGSIYAQQHKKDQALEKLKSVVHANPNDAEAWIEMAQVLEIQKPEQALEAYEKGLQLLENPPVELWNNIAVLRHKLGHVEDAREAYEQLGDQKRALVFNKARWLEDNGRLAEAKELYQKIIQDNPNYIDAYLRCALLSRTQGDYVQALEHARSAIKKDSKPSAALCLKASMEAELGELVKALETYNRVIMEYSRHDPYALTAMGCIYYELAVKHHKRERFQKNLEKSLQFFSKVISLDEHNLYAAIGIAIVMAEMDDHIRAHETFRNVMNCSELSFMLINDGHVALMSGRYDAALRLYQRAKELKAASNETLAYYIATAYFFSKRFVEAEEIMRTLPSSAQVNLNMAVILHERALFVFKNERRTIEETEDAIKCIEEAKTFYESVLQTRWVITGGSEARDYEKAKIAHAQSIANRRLQVLLGLQETSGFYRSNSRQPRERSISPVESLDDEDDGSEPRKIARYSDEDEDEDEDQFQ